MLGDNLFDVSYEKQFKSVDKDDMVAIINNIKNEYNSKNEEEKFLLELAMKDKSNGAKVSLLASIVFIIMLRMLSGIIFLNIISILLGIVIVWEAFLLEKEYRYARIYLDIINKLNKEME